MPELKKKQTSGRVSLIQSWLLLFLVCFIFPLFCSAQDPEPSLAEVWFDISKYFPVSNSLSLGGDTGVRGFVFEEEFTVVYIRPSFQYLLRDSLSLHGGVGVFYAFQEGPVNLGEIRPWGGVKLRWPTFKSIYLENYFRADGRFLRTQEIDEYLSVLRLRHRIGTVLPIADKKPGGEGFYLPVSFEVFFRGAGDIPARFINQTRFTVGLGYQLNSGWRLETSYNWIQFRPDAGDEFATIAHMFRIQIKG
jgi:hypothetical protein